MLYDPILQHPKAKARDYQPDFFLLGEDVLRMSSLGPITTAWSDIEDYSLAVFCGRAFMPTRVAPALLDSWECGIEMRGDAEVLTAIYNRHPGPCDSVAAMIVRETRVKWSMTRVRRKVRR
jgi:hypothetical protein